MKIDEEKIDEAVLALLYLTVHDDIRAWKQIDWNAMNRLHEKGLIHDPVGKAKSVMFTPEGLKESERLFQKLFTKES
ncbi:DUF6429 family protein [Marinobacter nauticus]|uniref:DUF6429 family protein n=1 Tax=Marinobacter nauticus TaxID=2743 RepID=UPI001CFE7ED4|nr:DUF6429 family protein [Marinobacter nauticus]